MWRLKSRPKSPETWSLNAAMLLASCIMSGQLGHITWDPACPFQLCQSVDLIPALQIPDKDRKQGEIPQPALARATTSHLLILLPSLVSLFSLFCLDS